MNNVLISLKPQYVKKVLHGRKTAELRTRPMNLLTGSKLWIYSTLPRAKIEVVAEVVSTHSGTPLEIWNKYSKQICISRDEFESYVNNRKIVYVILIAYPKKVSPAPDLNCLRSISAGFHPPQFLKKLSEKSPLGEYLLSLDACEI
jgi:predicted transcriptional regulator